MFNKIKVVVFTTLLLCISFPLAFASTVLQMDLKDLVHSSDLIVIGSVSKTHSFLRKGKVLTSIIIKPEKVLKGIAPQKIEIVQYGGRTKELITRVAGMPSFKVNEHVLLFLEKPKGSDSFVVSGLSQGKFKIAPGPDGHTPYIVPTFENAATLIDPKTKLKTTKLPSIHKVVSPLSNVSIKIIDLQK